MVLYSVIGRESGPEVSTYLFTVQLRCCNNGIATMSLFMFSNVVTTLTTILLFAIIESDK